MAQYKGFVFDGINSADYGVVITGASTYSAPERAVEMFDIPGRNGALAIDQGRFANIEITYHCAMADRNQATFAQRLSALRNQLCSRYSYVRLTDDYNADEYRLALYKSGLDADLVIDRGGEFDVVFDCKPQRFLTSGESTYQIGEWGQTITETGDIVTYQGDDLTAVKSLTTALEPIQDLHGYDSPWPAGGGKNLFSKDPLIRWFTKSVPSGGKIYAQHFNSGGNFNIYALDANDTEYTIGQVTSTKKSFTMPTDIVSFGISSSAVTTLGTGNLMISLSDFTQYEPYENICPIYGRTGQTVYVRGVNQWDGEYEGGYYDITDGSAKGSPSSTTGWQKTKNPIYCLPNTQYYFKSPPNFSGSFGSILFYDKNGDYTGDYITNSSAIFNKVFTTPDNCYQLKWYANIGMFANVTTPFSVNYPSTDHDYHAYVGTTYPVTFTEAGTVYGGTVDFVSGVLTVTHSFAQFNGAESWQRYTSGSAGAYACKLTNTTGTAVGGIRPISNYAKGLIAADIYGNYDCFISTSDGGSWIAGKRDITTAEGWKEYLAQYPLQVCYVLATPQTYQLTPSEIETLIGTNNVWSDAGRVTVEYGTDPYTMVNDTPFPSKPLIKVTGYGEVGFGDITITITGTAGVVTYIDCDLMECYRMSGGAIVPANQYVTFTGTDFPTIPTGKTRVTSASTISKVEVVPRWWII